MSNPIAITSAPALPLPFPLSYLLRYDKGWVLQGSSVFLQLLFIDGTTAKQTPASKRVPTHYSGSGNPARVVKQACSG